MTSHATRAEHAYLGAKSYGREVCQFVSKKGVKCMLPAECHRAPREDLFLGVDGEGKTVDGEHHYTLLAVSDETGERQWQVPAEPLPERVGLSTVQCLDFLLDLPHEHVKAFAYSFNYDLAKILKDVDSDKLYQLFRPELRVKRLANGKEYHAAIRWKDYSLNLLNTRFTVKRRKRGTDGRPLFDRKGKPVYGHAFTVHDIWRFFQGKFTAALEDWKIGNPHALARMREMKDKRATFDRESPEAVRAYCFEECRYMAELARKLTDAHEAVGLRLKNYFGAGSSASAMLQAMGLKEHIQNARTDNPVPEALEHAVACAFFGGRFENSVLGPVEGPVYSYDISSAYPYQLAFLPCLLHGKWAQTKDRKRVARARTALVRYRLDAPKRRANDAWAPFPFRLKTGSIVFPRSSGGGWIWRDEFLAGERLFPNVRFLEAWVYECDCDCQPFAKVPAYYRERLRIGKEGPGIVLKLGTNSCYGKLAQSLGGIGPFTSWVWAGLITSGCRAQILDVMGLHLDPSNLLMVATDGIATRENLDAYMPAPRDTGTADAVNEKGEHAGKPLGGWESKPIPRGLFLARPGIYFPLEPTEADLQKVRARGIGRKATFENWRLIVDTWAEANRKGRPETAVVRVANLSRFTGAKTGITRSGTPSAYEYKRSKDFGRWTKRPIDMSFNPLPKREGVDLETGKLGLRSFDGVESVPYNAARLSKEARELKALTDEALEQPDGGDLTDYSDYGPE